MTDKQPVDATLPAGTPVDAGAADAGDPKTLSMPPRWSGAAAVPSTGARRSIWGRLRARVPGAGRTGGDDEWPTMPAVDPWADQDTLAWTQGYPAVAVPGTDEPTRLDLAAAGPTTQAAAPAETTAPAAPARPEPVVQAEATRLDPADSDPRQDRVAALNARLDAASAAADAMEKKAAEAAKVAAAAAAAKAEAARAAVARMLAEKAEAKARAQAEAKARAETEARAQAEAIARPRFPAPGTYPPPAGGSGLPPLAPRKPRRWPWTAGKDRPATRTQPAPKAIPVQPRRPVTPLPPAPAPWLARPPKRRGRIRRALRRLTLFTVLGVVLLCGLPLAYLQFPAARQYPVSAVLPDSFADLSLRDTASARKAVDRLAEQLQESGSSANAFAGVYADGNGKRVTLFGATGFRLTPGWDVTAQLDRIAGDLGLTGVTEYDTGEFGVHERCGTGRLDGTAVVACTWADHGSLATVLLTRRSLEESAALVAQLRDEVLVPRF